MKWQDKVSLKLREQATQVQAWGEFTGMSRTNSTMDGFKASDIFWQRASLSM